MNTITAPMRNFPRVTLPGLPARTEATDLFESGKAQASDSLKLKVALIRSLRDTGRHVYRNTVSRNDIAARRAANKRAKIARRNAR